MLEPRFDPCHTAFSAASGRGFKEASGQSSSAENASNKLPDLGFSSMTVERGTCWLLNLPSPDPQCECFFFFVSREEFSRMPLKLERALRTFPDHAWRTQRKAVVLQEFRKVSQLVGSEGEPPNRDASVGPHGPCVSVRGWLARALGGVWNEWCGGLAVACQVSTCSPQALPCSSVRAGAPSLGPSPQGAAAPSCVLPLFAFPQSVPVACFILT